MNHLSQRVSLLLGAVWLLSAEAPGASGPPPAPGKGVWLRYVLPGAEVKCLAASPVERGLFWAGTAQGGVYRTTDGGRSWSGTGGSTFPGHAVSALAADPLSSSTVWAALTGVVRGGLLARSDDAGETWREVKRWEERAGARALALAVVEGQRLLAVGGDGGIELSTDGGGTWRASRPPLDPGSGISFLAFPPGRPSDLYAGSYRHPFLSSDLGVSWRRIAGGMVEDTEVFDLDFAAGAPGDIWAATCGWVYRTLDGGQRWVRFKEGLTDRRTHTVRRDPRNRSRLLAGTTGGVFESLDDGATFRRLGPEVVVNVLLFDPAEPSTLLAGTEDRGILRSQDGGATLVESNRGLSETRVSAVARLERGKAVVARAADGREGGLWTVDLATGESSRFLASPSATVVALAVHQGRLFAGTAEGVHEARGSKGPFQLVLPRGVRALLAGPGGLFAATSEGVYTSRDGDRGWRRAGSLLGRVDGLWLVRAPGGGTMVAARSEGRNWYWGGSDWTEDASAVEGRPRLGGGFGRPSTPRREPPVTVGVEIDETRERLVYRPPEDATEALVLPLPESGLSVSGWSGDPREGDGLLLATMGRGLFRFVPAGQVAAVSGPAAPRSGSGTRR